MGIFRPLIFAEFEPVGLGVHDIVQNGEKGTQEGVADALGMDRTWVTKWGRAQVQSQ